MDNFIKRVNNARPHGHAKLTAKAFREMVSVRDSTLRRQWDTIFHAIHPCKYQEGRKVEDILTSEGSV